MYQIDLGSSSWVIFGVVIVLGILFVLYYDAQAEAREKRLGWLFRKQNRASLFGDRTNGLIGRINCRELFFSAAISAVLVLVLLVFSARISFVLAGAAIAFVGALVIQEQLQRKQDRKKFEQAFPEAIEMLMRSVRIGVPLDEAFQSLGERFGGELARRLAVFNSEIALGQPFRSAGVKFCKGLNMPDVEFFFAVLSLNRESGSELTPTLEAMSYTLRERQKVRRRAVVLTSEIRSAAKVMAVLPFLLIAVMAVVKPDMVDFYLHDFTGQVILLVCTVAIIVGIVLLRDIANIED